MVWGGFPHMEGMERIVQQKRVSWCKEQFGIILLGTNWSGSWVTLAVLRGRSQKGKALALSEQTWAMKGDLLLFFPVNCLYFFSSFYYTLFLFNAISCGGTSLVLFIAPDITLVHRCWPLYEDCTITRAIKHPKKAFLSRLIIELIWWADWDITCWF